VTIHASGQPPEQALDALLAGYASGTLSAPLHALVAGHLELKPQSRAFVRSLESVSGADLEAISPVPVHDRDDKLKAIFASGPARLSLLEKAPSTVLPYPLYRYIGRDLPEIRWKSLLPGMKQCKVEETERGEAVLYWIKPGRKMPSHTHDGSEYTLVLRGSFSDVSGRYGPGDIAIADQEIDHRPVADPDEDCICFAVTDAPLRLTGPVGRVLQKVFGPRS
jgi:putative transcriptional regulator